MKRIAKIAATTIAILTLSLLLGISTSRTVRAAVTALVTVANTPANPVPATDVGPQQPYITGCSNTVYYYSIDCTISVPSGKRFIVENVSLYLQRDTAGQVLSAGIIPDNSNSTATFYINVPFSGQHDGNVSYTVDQPLKTYMEASPGPCFANFTNFTNATIQCAMSGYLVDVR